MHDADQVLTLLQIASLAKDWPELRPIHNRAMEKLLQIAKEHKDSFGEPAKPAPKPEAPAPRPLRTGA